MNLEIMDCTLRDGGYINNWQFSYVLAGKIIKSLDRAGVEKIECGYLADSKNNSQRTIFSSLTEFNYLIESLKKDITSELYLMIDHNGFELSKLNESKYLKGIRYAFHKKDFHNIYKNISLIRETGYEVCLQPMITSVYSEAEIYKLAEISNELNIEALYIVDSLGNIESEELKSIYMLMDKKLKPEIKIGFHAHNNMQMAFSNSISFIRQSQAERKLITDSSIGGLGRGAGNLNTEMITAYLNKRFKGNYSISEIINFIENDNGLFKKDLRESFIYFYAGLFSLHPNHPYSFLKQDLTVNEIIKRLDEIDNK